MRNYVSFFFSFPLGEPCNWSCVTILLFACEKTQTNPLPLPPDKKLQWQKYVSVCSSTTPVYNEHETTESFRNRVRINHAEAKLCAVFFWPDVAFLVFENNQPQLFFPFYERRVTTDVHIVK